ncbi:MAG TPA: cyclase family protein [Pseudonocardia sp.]|uniref:cyclase family protein n=1 Tax=Pseudonocardia sp. TaxID=60912 RepID=UPI002F3EBEE8
MSETKSVADLLANAPSNWGRWGEDDEVGALNYLTPAEVLRGVSHIRSGTVFTLQRLIGDPNGDPVWPGREPATRTMLMDEATWDSPDAPKFPGGLHYADDKIEAFLQGSTQYDALGHVWYDGKIWNGYDARTTIGGLDKASVAPIAERGVVGRGVLLDMARFRGKDNLDKGETFDHTDLQECARAQGVTIEPHDVLVIRTNFLKLFYEQGEKFYQDFREPGLTYSPELVQWFADREIPNLVTDTIANETTYEPETGIALPLHCALMRNLGVTLTELCDVEKLAASCAEDGQYTFLYVAAPLKVHRATGSPVNPLAIK